MNKALMFVLGAAAGSLLTWKLLEKKYKDMAEDEINIVREHYRNKQKEKVEAIVEHYIEEDKLDNSTKEYTKTVNDLGYTTTVTTYADGVPMEYSVEEDGSVYIAQGPEQVAPYVIAPEEYGNKDFYDLENWTYYADGVMTDSNDEIVWDPERTIGDALSHFGDYEDDAVHVRNENTKCDYEILKHELTFTEVNGEDI